MFLEMVVQIDLVFLIEDRQLMLHSLNDMTDSN